MKCPHCNRIIKDERVENCYLNAENYGSNYFHLDCLKCGKMYEIYLSRIVRMDEKPKLTEQKYSDF
jgi:Fe2+ or Zn2+ uptake regulation protein